MFFKWIHVPDLSKVCKRKSFAHELFLAFPLQLHYLIGSREQLFLWESNDRCKNPNLVFFSLKICFGIFILMTRYEKKNGQKKSLEYFSKTLRQTLDNTLVKTGTMLKWLFHILGGGRCRGSLKKFAECLKKWFVRCF